MRTEQGWIIVSILRDVSERARAEQLQNLEHSIARCLAEADSASVALNAVMRAICEIRGLGVRALFHGWTKTQACCASASTGAWPDPTVEQFIAGTREAALWAGRRDWPGGCGNPGSRCGPPIPATDAARLWIGRQPRHRHARRVRFPVVSEGKTIGVLTFYSREVREPDERLLRAVHAIGSQIGQFLQRKQAEDGVRESEARFRSLTTLSSDWYWEQDAEYRFVDMTSEIDRMTGVSAPAPTSASGAGNSLRPT